MPSIEVTARARLLSELCAVACELLEARAASVALHDVAAGELVFVAGAGEGAEQIEGARFKAAEGIAGEVLRSGEPLVVAELPRDPRFAHDIAVASGYDPEAMAVAPIKDGGRTVGVLSVLDPRRDATAALGPLAGQAAATLRFAAAVGAPAPALSVGEMPAITWREGSDRDLIARLGEEISAFNFAATEIRDGIEFCGSVRDEAGALAAGIQCWTWGGTAWIERLWVREDHRGQGLGTQLLEATEAEARTRGCTQIALTTHSFQAPDFYRRHGFSVAGEVADYPAGHSYLLMRRPLAP